MTAPADTFTLSVQADRNDLTVTRELDAPRELVFACLTEPEHVARWWDGGGSGSFTIDEMDARPGGRWRYLSGEQGEHAFHGWYHQVEAPHRLVYTFEYEPMAGHVLMETLDLVDLGGGRTRVVDHSAFQSVQDRDGMVAAGMESGARRSYEQLDALLARLQV